MKNSYFIVRLPHKHYGVSRKSAVTSRVPMSVVDTGLPWLRYLPPLPLSRPLTMREKDSSPRKMLVAAGGHSSPKQAAVYPLSVRVPPGDDMPFDLSRNTRSPGPHMSPAGRPPPGPQDGDDQPLDLRVEHKKLSLMLMRRHVEDENRNLISPVASVNSDKEEVTVEERTSPVGVNHNNNVKAFSPQIPGYPVLFPPQPIHPMMLEAMYRAQGGDKVPRLQIPYPNSPPGYPQRYPFLSPTMLSPPVSQVPFDMLRTPPVPQPPKVFADTTGNKMKDRYAYRHLKKHESDGPTILDERNLQRRNISNRHVGDDSYFEEIRSFMGKVTDGRLLPHLQPPRPLPNFPLSLPSKLYEMSKLPIPQNDKSPTTPEENKRDSSYFSEKDNFSSRSSTSSESSNQKEDDIGDVEGSSPLDLSFLFLYRKER
ncbi:hypothetical protein ILUMI_23842 [Ignelater luminosus]|uniref:Uncharacterized protein n=1 Tax=Ignelater luminosus TaxID=2038154 RepID=A0A8K0C7C1_IGNLU|nr:hypothetical protein ILUMI_23842 [Ignelater luminosus]